MSKSIGAVFKIKDQFSSQVKNIVNAVKKSESAVKKAGSEVKSFGKLKAAPVIEIKDRATDKVNDIKNNIKSMAKTKVAPVIEIKDKVTNVTNKITNKMKQMVKTRYDIVLDMKDRVSSQFEGIGSKFSNLVSKIKGNSIKGEVDKIVDGTKKSGRAFNDASKDASSFGQSVKGGFATAATSVKSLVIAMGVTKALSGAFNMVKEGVGTAFGRIDVMEQFERTMTTITGSTEATKKALDKTTEAVTGTGYGLDVAAKSVQDFVTRGMEIDKATDVVETWGDAVAFYGDGSNDQLARVTDALGKMTSKGKVEMDQMNTLFDAGIDGVGMFAKATGRDINEVSKALSKGEISSTEFVDVVTDAMKNGTNGVEKIAGAAKEAGASWGAAMSNMKARVAIGVTNIIKSFDSMLESKGLPQMRDIIETFGNKFRDVLNGIADNIPKVADKIEGLYNSIKDSTIFSFMSSGFDVIKESVSNVIPTIVELWERFKDSSAYNTLTNTMENIKSIFEFIFPIIKEHVMNGLAAIREFWIEHGESIISVVSNAFNLIKNTFLIVLAAIGGVVIIALTSIKVMWDMFGKDIINIIKIAFNLVGRLIEGAMKIVQGVIDVAMGLITGNWTRAWEGIKSILSGIWSGITGIIETGVNSAIGLINSLIGAINKIKLPDWLGGGGLNIPTVSEFSIGGAVESASRNTRGIQENFRGTDSFSGGLTTLHEKGEEVYDLPEGTRIYPHSKSLDIAREQGRKESSKKVVSSGITISGNTFNVRQESDIDSIATQLFKKIQQAQLNMT